MPSVDAQLVRKDQINHYQIKIFFVFLGFLEEFMRSMKHIGAVKDYKTVCVFIARKVSQQIFYTVLLV